MGAGTGHDGSGLTSITQSASTAPTLQATSNQPLISGNITTSGIAGPDPGLYNTFNPWAVGSYQGYQQQNANAGTVLNADGSSAIPAAQQSLSSQGLVDARAGQTSLANTLATQAAGGGMSAADIQQQQGITNSVQAAQAAAATAGNSANPFLLQRQLMQNQAATNQAGVGQASLLRAQETAQAQQALGGVLSDQAGSQLQQNAAAAQLAQGNSQYAQTAMQNAANAYAIGQQNLAQQIQAARTGSASNVAAQDIANANNAQSQTNAIIGAAGNVVSGVAGVAAKSDERAKENIDRGGTDAQLDDFMGSLDHASYDYKRPEQDGTGRHWGIMAQSAERSDAGRSMVVQMPDGQKGLDLRRGLGLALAGLSRLAERQDHSDALLASASRRLRG